MTDKDAEALAAEYGVSYYEASAKTNVNVAAAFEDLAAKIVRRKLAAPSGGGAGGTSNLVLKDEDAKPKGKCCG